MGRLLSLVSAFVMCPATQTTAPLYSHLNASTLRHWLFLDLSCVFVVRMSLCAVFLHPLNDKGLDAIVFVCVCRDRGYVCAVKGICVWEGRVCSFPCLRHAMLLMINSATKHALSI